MHRYFKNIICAVALLVTSSSGCCQWGESPTSKNISSFHKISIVFAAQNTKSPLSMFGHVYLVFHDEKSPEPNAITFEFTGSIDSVKDYLGTVTGAASGFYKLDYYDNKRREYDLENRSSWRYEILLTEEESRLLKKKIAELEGRKYKYTVFKKNCASYLVEEISKIRGLAYQSESIFFDSPDAIIRWLYANKLINQSVFTPSTQLKALKYFNKLSDKEKSDLKQLVSGYTIKNNNYSEEFASAISSSVDYLMVRDDSYEGRANLFALKKQFPRTLFEIENDVTEPINISSNSSYSALVSNDGLLLKFRPGFLGYENEHLYGLKNVSSEFLAVGVLLNSNSIQLDGLTLFKVESYVPNEFLHDSGSQLFDISYKNYRSFYDKQHAEFSVNFARGFTSSYENQLISFLPLISLRKINSGNVHESALSMGGRLRIYGNFNNWLSYRSTYDYYATKDEGVRKVWDSELFSLTSLRYGLSLNHSLINSHSRFGVRFFKSF